MKRLFSLTIIVLVLAAIVMTPAASFACGDNKLTKSTEAKQISGKAGCSAAEAKACADKLGIPVEECRKLCSTGDYTLVSMSVTGMTCGGCESTIAASLKEVPGVVKVGLVSHKDGSAFVLVNPREVNNESLVTAVTSKGYKAKVIPAAALMVPDSEIKPASSAKGCGMVSKKVCSPRCAVTCGIKGVKKARKTEETGNPTGTK